MDGYEDTLNFENTELPSNKVRKTRRYLWFIIIGIILAFVIIIGVVLAVVLTGTKPPTPLLASKLFRHNVR